MDKKKLLDLCESVFIELGENLSSKRRELENGDGDGKNVKSLKSVICGIKKNHELSRLLIKLINDEEVDDDDVKLIERLRYNRKTELVEVSKEKVIKEDLIDKVIIKKVNGVNKYFIEC